MSRRTWLLCIVAFIAVWILLLVVFIYGPILVESMRDPGKAVQVQGINYFADTLLFAGAILGLADATKYSDEAKLRKNET